MACYEQLHDSSVQMQTAVTAYQITSALYSSIRQSQKEISSLLPFGFARPIR